MHVYLLYLMFTILNMLGSMVLLRHEQCLDEKCTIGHKFIYMSACIFQMLNPKPHPDQAQQEPLGVDVGQ